ncbi:MAG TPA: chorismate mutase [Cellvibrio sp.]|nr:chorismate mutase [Cellvibrio sp.]
MNNIVTCNSLEEVRSNIDVIDQKIVSLIAQRGGFVMQAARFKKTTEDVKAPQRVEQVISKVRALATELGANPDVTESVYRAMISAFINTELAEHSSLTSNTVKS